MWLIPLFHCVHNTHNSSSSHHRWNLSVRCARTSISTAADYIRSGKRKRMGATNNERKLQSSNWFDSLRRNQCEASATRATCGAMVRVCTLWSLICDSLYRKWRFWFENVWRPINVASRQSIHPFIRRTQREMFVDTLQTSIDFIRLNAIPIRLRESANRSLFHWLTCVVVARKWNHQTITT